VTVKRESQLDQERRWRLLLLLRLGPALRASDRAASRGRKESRNFARKTERGDGPAEPAVQDDERSAVIPCVWRAARAARPHLTPLHSIGPFDPNAAARNALPEVRAGPLLRQSLPRSAVRAGHHAHPRQGLRCEQRGRAD
jgi:hypothetical protein